MNKVLANLDEIACHIKAKLDQGDPVSRGEALHLVKQVDRLRNEARKVMGLTLEHREEALGK